MYYECKYTALFFLLIYSLETTANLLNIAAVYLFRECSIVWGSSMALPSTFEPFSRLVHCFRGVLASYDHSIDLSPYYLRLGHGLLVAVFIS